MPDMVIDYPREDWRLYFQNTWLRDELDRLVHVQAIRGDGPENLSLSVWDKDGGAQTVVGTQAALLLDTCHVWYPRLGYINMHVDNEVDAYTMPIWLSRKVSRTARRSWSADMLYSTSITGRSAYCSANAMIAACWPVYPTWKEYVHRVQDIPPGNITAGAALSHSVAVQRTTKRMYTLYWRGKQAGRLNMHTGDFQWSATPSEGYRTRCRAALSGVGVPV